jgi:hypothetical protein
MSNNAFYMKSTLSLLAINVKVLYVCLEKSAGEIPLFIDQKTVDEKLYFPLSTESPENQIFHFNCSLLNKYFIYFQTPNKTYSVTAKRRLDWRYRTSVFGIDEKLS